MSSVASPIAAKVGSLVMDIVFQCCVLVLPDLSHAFLVCYLEISRSPHCLIIMYVASRFRFASGIWPPIIAQPPFSSFTVCVAKERVPLPLSG